MKFVSKHGNNFQVYDGEAGETPRFEVVDPALSHKNKSGAFDVKESAKEIINELGAEGNGQLFSKPVTDAPDPSTLLAFIDELNSKDNKEEEFVENKATEDLIADILNLEHGVQEESDEFVENTGPQMMGAINLDSDDDKVFANQTSDNTELDEGVKELLNSVDIEDEPIGNEFTESPVNEQELEPEAEPVEPEKSIEEELIELKALLEEQESEIAELKKKLDEKESFIAKKEEDHSQKIKDLEAQYEIEADEAYKKGAEEANLEANKKIETIENELAEFINNIPNALNSYLEDIEEQVKNEVCEFSLNIAEGIIRSKFNDRDELKENILATLTNIVNTKGVKLYLNPKAVEILQNSEDIQISNNIEVLSDDSLELGDVKLETNMGIIDSTLKRRLADLAEQFSKPKSIEE